MTTPTDEQQAFINGMSNHARVVWARAGYPIGMVDKLIGEHIHAAPGNWVDSPQSSTPDTIPAQNTP